MAKTVLGGKTSIQIITTSSWKSTNNPYTFLNLRHLYVTRKRKAIFRKEDLASLKNKPLGIDTVLDFYPETT